MFGNPGEGAVCVDVPILAIQSAEAMVGEADGTVTVQFYIDNPNAMETTVEVVLVAGGTADAIQEPEENFTIEIINPSNGAIITNGTMNFTIIDNDAPPANALKIIGLVHGPVGGVPKATQFYATADIPDLSKFGVGCPNNGGGTDGQEYTFPAEAIDEGTCFFLTNDQPGFLAFFGFEAEFVNDGAANNFNSDDACELFENGTVIDVFGDIQLDGTGEPWEYTLGWAHRKPGTGPDGSTFVLDNWEFGGLNIFVDTLTNEESPFPYPIDECEESNATEEALSSQILVYPNPASNVLHIESAVLLEKITVSNLLGQVVLAIKNPGLHSTLD